MARPTFIPAGNLFSWAGVSFVTFLRENETRAFALPHKTTAYLRWDRLSHLATPELSCIISCVVTVLHPFS